MELEKLEKLFYTNLTIKQIGEKLGLSKTSTTYWIKKYSLKRKPLKSNKLTKKFNIDGDKFKELLNEKSIKEISKELGFSISTIRKHAKKYIEKSKYFCQSCGEELKSKKRKNKFCNSECNQNFIFEKTLSKFEKGEIKDSKTIISIFKKNKIYKCQVCKNEGVWENKKLTLQVDHVDGDSTNNLPSNIRLLCPNCHTQTETWGIKNKKKGRRKLKSVL